MSHIVCPSCGKKFWDIIELGSLWCSCGQEIYSQYRTITQESQS